MSADPPRPESNETPPEVEAEIVEPGETGSLDADETLSAETAPPPPKRRLFPGLIVFFAFVAAALGAFLIWRFQTPPGQEGAVASQSAAVESEPPSAADEPQAEVQTQAADASKIANSMGEVKDELQGFDTGDTVAGRGLPPAPPAGTSENEALQDAAKRALRTLQESAAAEDEVPGAGALHAEPSTAMPQAQAPPPTAEPSDPLAELQAQAEQEELQPQTAPSVMEQTPPAPEPGVDAKVGNDLAALKAQLEEERRRSAAQEQEIAALRVTLDRLLEERRGSALHATPSYDKIRAAPDPVGLSLALLSLQRAIDSGSPFVGEIERVERLAPEAPGLRVLRKHAERGVPSFSALRARFPQAAREAIAAAARDEAQGPLGGFFARLKGLVSARPARPTAGASAPAIISRAEGKLAAEDLQGVVDELGELSGGAKEAFAAWLSDAQARLDARRAVDDIGESVAAARRG
jgi:hypothetical protein